MRMLMVSFQASNSRWAGHAADASFHLITSALGGYSLTSQMQATVRCRVLTHAHDLLQFAYPMPQQSMPQHAAAGNYQLSAGMYANPFPQQQQQQSYSGAEACNAMLQQAPGLPLPPPVPMPASGGLGTSTGFPGPQGFSSSFSGGSMADALPGRSSSAAGGVPLDLPRSYGFSNTAGYPAGITLGDKLDRPSFTSGSGDLPLPSQGGASSGSSVNVGANGGWGLGAGARASDMWTLSSMPVNKPELNSIGVRTSAGHRKHNRILFVQHFHEQHAGAVKGFTVLPSRCSRPP